MIIRDFYFASWLIHKHGYSHNISEGKIYIDIDKNIMSILFKEYSDTDKKYFNTVRKLVKEANLSR